MAEKTRAMKNSATGESYKHHAITTGLVLLAGYTALSCGVHELREINKSRIEISVVEKFDKAGIKAQILEARDSANCAVNTIVSEPKVLSSNQKELLSGEEAVFANACMAKRIIRH